LLAGVQLQAGLVSASGGEAGTLGSLVSAVAAQGKLLGRRAALCVQQLQNLQEQLDRTREQLFHQSGDGVCSGVCDCAPILALTPLRLPSSLQRTSELAINHE